MKTSPHWLLLEPIHFNQPSAYILHVRGVVFAILNQGIKVDLLIPTPSNNSIIKQLFSHENLTVHTYGTAGIHNNFLSPLFALPKLKNLLKSKKFKVFYTRMGLLTFITQSITKLWFTGLTVTEHNGFLKEEFTSLLPKPLKWFKYIGHLFQIWDAHLNGLIRVVTKEIKQRLIEAGIPSEKIIVASNGTDISLFKPLVREKCLESKNLNSKNFYIGFIGTLTDWQAVDHLIQAFNLIKDLPIHLLIAGQGSEKQNLEKSVLKLGLNDRVHFLGPIPILEAPIIINCFDIAVASMKNQLFQTSGSAKIKIRDYAACGRCILAGNVSEHLELEKKGVLYTYTMDNIQDLADKMSILYHDHETQAKLAKKSYVYAKKNLTWPSILKPLFESTK